MSFVLTNFATGVASAVQSPIIQAAVAEIQQTEELQEEEPQQQHITRPYFSNFATLAVKKVSSIGKPPYLKQKVLAATDYFIFASFQEQDQERTSVRFTMGDSLLYAGAGRQPRLYSYSGFLVDTEVGGPAISNWRGIYDKFLRGTKCVKNKAVVEFEYRDQYRLGYIHSCTLTYDATKPTIVPFSFVMFVIKERSKK